MEVEYMGNKANAKYKFQKNYVMDNVAVYELSFMQEKPEAYKGAELLFRVNNDAVSEEILNESKEAIEYLKDKYKKVLKETNVEKEYAKTFLKNGIAMCCDVTPKEKDGQILLDVSMKYINFNPWAEENLADNKVLNGEPKTLQLSGGFVQGSINRVNLDLFPQYSLEVKDINVKDYKKEFAEKFDSELDKLYDKEDKLMESLVTKDYHNYDLDNVFIFRNICNTVGTEIENEYKKQ